MPKRLRKLTRREIECLWDHIIQLAQSGNTEDPFWARLRVSTCIDFPLGELLNPRMRELVMILAQTRSFIHGEITREHQFGTQGLEGLITVEDVPLSMALLAATKTGIYRIAIFVSRDCDLLRDSPEEGK
jgi:hypothetical protein